MLVRSAWILPAVSGLFLFGAALGLLIRKFWLPLAFFTGALGLIGWGFWKDRRFLVGGMILLITALGLARALVDLTSFWQSVILWLQPVLGAVSFFKGRLNHILESLFFLPTEPLLKALLLGDRQALPYNFIQVLNQTGTRHLVAISGLHIGIIGTALWRLARSLPLTRFFQAGFVLTFLAGYVLMIGAPPSAVRAALMAGVFIVSLVLHRGGRLWHSLMTAALIMIILEPRQLASVSFQLSFLAVAGILTLKPFLDSLLFFLPNPLKLRDLLSISLAVLVFLWPVLAFYFGRLSLVSPLANLVVVPLVPFLIIGGLVVLVLGWLWLPLGLAAALPVQKLGEFMVDFLTILAGWPYVSLGIHSPILLVVSYYPVLTLLIIWLNYRYANDLALS